MMLEMGIAAREEDWPVIAWKKIKRIMSKDKRVRRYKMKKELSNEPWAMNVLMDGVDFEKAGRFAKAENCYWEAFSLWRKHQGVESMLAQKAFDRLI